VRVAVTGTPGTGKSTALERLAADPGDFDTVHDEFGLDVIHLNEVIHEEGLTTEHDEARDSAVADLDAVADYLEGREDVLFESHLAHHFAADRVVVLRCHPEPLAERLRDRGESEEKAEENAESEALDVVLAEAVDRHGADSVYEVDTTDRDPGETAAAIASVVTGEREPAVGTVSFIDYLQ
jgi:adenylate kinase